MSKRFNKLEQMIIAYDKEVLANYRLVADKKVLGSNRLIIDKPTPVKLLQYYLDSHRDLRKRNGEMLDKYMKYNSLQRFVIKLFKIY